MKLLSLAVIVGVLMSSIAAADDSPAALSKGETFSFVVDGAIRSATLDGVVEQPRPKGATTTIICRMHGTAIRNKELRVEYELPPTSKVTMVCDVRILARFAIKNVMRYLPIIGPFAGLLSDIISSADSTGTLPPLAWDIVTRHEAQLREIGDLFRDAEQVRELVEFFQDDVQVELMEYFVDGESLREMQSLFTDESIVDKYTSFFGSESHRRQLEALFMRGATVAGAGLGRTWWFMKQDDGSVLPIGGTGDSGEWQTQLPWLEGKSEEPPLDFELLRGQWIHRDWELSDLGQLSTTWLDDGRGVSQVFPVRLPMAEFQTQQLVITAGQMR